VSSNARFREAVEAVCRLKTTRESINPDGSTAALSFVPAEDETPERIAAAQAVAAAFDPSPEAQAEWEEDKHPERKSIRRAAAQAVADNATFLALATPTNAQVLAQVKRLTQQNTAIIRRLIQLD
jgi:acyl-CoA reductase-like NAD-dependent aldehyde dehydrogenase